MQSASHGAPSPASGNGLSKLRPARADYLRYDRSIELPSHLWPQLRTSPILRIRVFLPGRSADAHNCLFVGQTLSRSPSGDRQPLIGGASSPPVRIPCAGALCTTAARGDEAFHALLTHR